MRVWKAVTASELEPYTRQGWQLDSAYPPNTDQVAEGCTGRYTARLTYLVWQEADHWNALLQAQHVEGQLEGALTRMAESLIDAHRAVQSAKQLGGRDAVSALLESSERLVHDAVNTLDMIKRRKVGRSW